MHIADKQLFFELVQASLGNREKLSHVPSEHEWKNIYVEAQHQGVVGVLVDGIERLPQQQRPVQMLLLEWIGVAQMVMQRNDVLIERSIEIQEVFAAAGFRSCILKGQGNSLMYPKPGSRMPGDIDLWIDGDRQAINEFVDSIAHSPHKGYKDVAFRYKDVEIETHYFPTYMNSNSKNNILQQYIKENKEFQFSHSIAVGDSKLCVPTDDFNVIYQMCHMCNHFFCEGIGLRHFIDYYYLLRRIAEGDLPLNDYRLKVRDLFQKLGMIRFVSGVMWIEERILGLESESLLTETDEKTGRLILNEILVYGNFNKAGMEGKSVTESKLSNTFRPFKYIFQFPKESIDRILFLIRLQLWKLRNKK